MIKAKWFSANDITKIQHACESQKYNLIFLGDDFCDRLMLDEETVISVFRLISHYNISLGIKTPVITEYNMDAHCKFIEFLGNLQSKIYITINDWGLFHFILDRGFTNLEMIIGRFLTRQKVDRFTNQLKGKIPDMVYRHFCTPTLLNEGFINYAHLKGVHFYEIENVSNSIVFPQLDSGYEIMLSFPYVCTALTRYCPYYQCDNDYLEIRMCNKECLDEKLSLQAKIHGEYKFIGNALVYENQNLSGDLNVKILLDESERG